MQCDFSRKTSHAHWKWRTPLNTMLSGITAQPQCLILLPSPATRIKSEEHSEYLAFWCYCSAQPCILKVKTSKYQDVWSYCPGDHQNVSRKAFRVHTRVLGGKRKAPQNKVFEMSERCAYLSLIGRLTLGKPSIVEERAFFCGHHIEHLHLYECIIQQWQHLLNKEGECQLWTALSAPDAVHPPTLIKCRFPLSNARQIIWQIIQQHFDDHWCPLQPYCLVQSLHSREFECSSDVNWMNWMLLKIGPISCRKHKAQAQAL